MKYSMCYFPLIGVVIGLLEYLAYQGIMRLGMESVFRGVVLSLIPVFVTGGIHMDGFMDTMDARSSWGDREKKLEILKDSHTGAFAILGCVVYMMITAALWSEITPEGIRSVCLCFAVSRCLSGIAVAKFDCAKNSGLLHTFSSGAHKKTVYIVLMMELTVLAAAMVLVSPLCGSLMLLAAAMVFLYYRWFSYKDFGGITGDLAGYFLQLCEAAMIFAVVTGCMIGGAF